MTSPSKPMFIIAEIGINHNGQMDICKELINVAHSAGCDAVKFQKRDIETVYTEEFLSQPRQSPWGTTQRDQKYGLEFGFDEYKEIDSYCRSLNLAWFASPWDLKSLEFLDCFDLKYLKVASPVLADYELVKAIAERRKYTFISTGMSTLGDIRRVAQVFDDANCPYEIMHCVSTYPMKDTDANLRVIDTLRENFGCPIGFSSHETGLVISYAATAFGISSLERHITLDRAMYGSDQASSIEPNGLRQLVSGIRKIEQSLGDGIKTFTTDEKTIAEKLRQHLDPLT